MSSRYPATSLTHTKRGKRCENQRNNTGSVEALELFRSAPDRFDLVITDMTMPNMAGDQLTSELLSIRPELPIIISTGYSEKITEHSVAHLGARGLIYKPIVKSKLAEVIRRVLDGG